MTNDSIEHALPLPSVFVAALAALLGATLASMQACRFDAALEQLDSAHELLEVAIAVLPESAEIRRGHEAMVAVAMAAFLVEGGQS